jgi:hypothetical protein
MYQVISFRVGSARSLVSPLITLAVLAAFLVRSLDLSSLDRDVLEAALARPGNVSVVLLGIATFVLLFRLLPALLKSINRTEVRFGGGRLLVGSSPIPAFSAVDVAAYEIRELSLSAQSGWFSDKARFMLVARSQSGEKLKLVEGIPDKQAAMFIEEQLQNRLGLASKSAPRMKVRKPSSTFSSTFSRSVEHEHSLAAEDKAAPEPPHSHAKEWLDAVSGRNLSHRHTSAGKQKQQAKVRRSEFSARKLGVSALPRHISVAREGSASVITRHWNMTPQNYSPNTVRAAVTILALLFLLLSKFFSIGFVLLFSITVGFLFYRRIADHINRTEIRIDPTWITSKHMPLFWLACAAVPVKNVESLRIDRVAKVGKDSEVTYTWSILAKIGSSEFDILVNLPTVTEARLMKAVVGEVLQLEESDVISAETD